LIYSALIPVKPLNEAKSRLAPYLTRPQRVALILDMLHHVVCVLRNSDVLTNINIVSADERILTLARTWDIMALVEERAGHNPALTAAATQLRTAGTDVLLTISADLPYLQPRHIQDMIEQSKTHPIVLAASQDRTGTNATLVRPPLAVPYVFGINSYHHYQQEAQQRGLSTTTYISPGTAQDIDTIDDIAAMQKSSQDIHSISP